MQWGERSDYEYVPKKHKTVYESTTKINFNHKEMLGHCKTLLERGYIAIYPVFEKVNKTFKNGCDGRNILDIESTLYSDVFDAL
jgi:hypothetical protein